MKKITIFIALAGAIAVSCKKDRTCECTDTVISQTSTEPGYTYTPQPATTNSTKYFNVKKSNELITTCVSSEQTNSYVNTVYDSIGKPKQYVITSVSKSDCTIK